MAWVTSVLHVLVGVLFLAGGIAWIVAEGLVRFPFPFLLLAVGSIHVSAGVAAAPSVQRRARERRAESAADAP
jgi:hypothetical protein